MANLHTLDSDILYEILTSCPDLATLYSLITTHPTIYYVFSTRRRLILRSVFRKWQSNSLAEAFIVRLQCANLSDYVAFREALWPRFSHLWPNKRSVTWATALLAAYHNAGLREEELCFATKIDGLIIGKARAEIGRELRTLARAVVRTYVAAKRFQKAVVLQEEVRQRLDPRKAEHSVWSKGLVVVHRTAGDSERALRVQIECWEHYKNVVGPGSEVALDWARAVVREYQGRGQKEEALEFHEKVRSELDPTTAPYVAWSRQSIHMLWREKRGAEALVVTEEVWRHLDLDAKGYRAWTGQLSAAYEAMGRPEAAVALCEACWTGVTRRLDLTPHSGALKYQAKGAGLMFVNVLRRCGRLEDARHVAERCKQNDS